MEFDDVFLFIEQFCIVQQPTSQPGIDFPPTNFFEKCIPGPSYCKPLRLLISIPDGIIQPRPKICIARREPKKREIGVRSTDNDGTNDGGIERG